ncbi:uncharacterized protein EV420DRAFT_1729216 [Desarmillaria tabescens]|uniref:Uncharacterized protein n=1 Tax=Armillaria tabescens TaxID=1929756 RepID=A0AA39NDT4_ARMTA|nr:uncharacterized protein EV420DRAFT_1729216 [Desarmillaria tabescens]KAK0463761.1 hypothetical protein EV420DRAFT_1729216 [Desarmillaria tabescens]
MAKFETSPPWYSYFTFSIDVAATLQMYCDGGDDAMLQKLEGLQDRKYAGYCFYYEASSEEDPKYYTLRIRPVQQGLTKSHPRKPQHARPTMCLPILPTTAHSKLREPMELSKSLPWDNCYHPTCYDLCARIPAEQKDYSQAPYVRFSRQLSKAIEEDGRYRDLLQAGVDDDRALQITDGHEDAPDTDVPDNASDIDGLASQMFMVKIPGSSELEEELIFMPVMRVDPILANVPEIGDPSQLFGDLDLFQEIVQEYQLARYGSALFDSPEDPIDDCSVQDDFSKSCSSFTDELSSDTPDSHELHSSTEESRQVPVPNRKGKWRIKSLSRRAISNLAEVLKWRKLSNKS